MKTIVKLVIAALIVNACWHAGASFLRYTKFKDEVQSTAQFASAKSDAELQARVVEIANQLQVPVLAENITVRRKQNHTMIDAVYVDHIEVVPTKLYSWEFKVNVDAFTVDMPAGTQ